MKREKAVSMVDALPAGELFFTKIEMARLLKVSMRTLNDMMQRGEVAYLKINGRLVRFRLEDVNRRLSETVLVCQGVVEGQWLRVEGLHGPGKGQNDCTATSPPAPMTPSRPLGRSTGDLQSVRTPFAASQAAQVPRQTAERVAPVRSGVGAKQRRDAR